MLAFKLMHVRRDGSIGSLYLNRRLRIEPGTWLDAEDHSRRGLAYRPGWHCTSRPYAPHIAERPDRRWYRVEIEGVHELARPERQGGTWLVADRMRVLEEAGP